MAANQKTPLASLRIGKWLWCARFFKTRSLATQAIHGGHVKLNGYTVKPARDLRVGDVLDIARGHTTSKQTDNKQQQRWAQGHRHPLFNFDWRQCEALVPRCPADARRCNAHCAEYDP